MPRRRVIGWTVVIAAVAAAALVGLASKSSPSGGRRAPALPAEHLSGAPTTLAGAISAAHGRPVMVVFWASWCEPCQREAPALESFATSPAGSGRLIGVDWSDGLPGARSFVRHYAWSFPNVRDAEGTVGNAYGITGLPTTFVIDPAGRIVDVLRGPQTAAALEHALARA